MIRIFIKKSKGVHRPGPPLHTQNGLQIDKKYCLKAPGHCHICFSKKVTIYNVIIALCDDWIGKWIFLHGLDISS